MLGPRVPLGIAEDRSVLRVGNCRFQVVLLSHTGPAALDKPIDNPRSEPLPCLRVAEYIPAKVGQQLRQAGQYYADLMGNVWLIAEPLGLTLLVSGLRGRKLLPVRGTAFQPQGLRLLFHLLATPELLKLPDAVLAKRVGVSLFATTNALADLAQQGFLRPGTERCLENPAELLARWVVGYRITLRPQLPTQCYHWLSSVKDELSSFRLACKTQSLWSGAAAARRLLPCTLVPATWTLYTRNPHTLTLLRKMGLIPHPEGPVEVIKVFPLPTVLAEEYCAHPLLIYADLLAAGDDESREVARQLLARYLPHLEATRGPLRKRKIAPVKRPKSAS